MYFVDLNASNCHEQKEMLPVSNTARKTKDRSGHFEFNSLLQ